MPGMLLNGHFHDPETLNAVTRRWNLDFQQLDAGRFDAVMHQMGTQQVFLSTCYFNRKLEQRGYAPEGCLTFGLPMRDEIRLRRLGREISGADLVLFRPGDEVDAVTEANFGAQTVTISHAKLEEAAELRGFGSGAELVGEWPSQTLSDVARWSLRATATRMTRRVNELPNLIENPHFIDDFETDMVNCVVDAFVRSESRLARPMARSRSRALKKALQVIADRCHEPVSVAQLQQETGVSARTLLYAFKEEFGMSPKEYLQVYRMRKVRHALVAGNAYKQSVSDLANDWGFWHMGQFAADYKKLFGELPSQTLRN